MKDKPINNYVDFLNELEKGNKNICVSDEFYNWLKENIEFAYTSRDVKGPIASFNSVRVYREEKEDENKNN